MLMKPLMTEIEIDIRRQLRRVERIHGPDHYAALARWSNCQRHRLAGHVVRRIPTQLRSRVHSEGPRRRATVFRPEPVASKLKTNDDPKPTSNPLNFFLFWIRWFFFLWLCEKITTAIAQYVSSRVWPSSATNKSVWYRVDWWPSCLLNSNTVSEGPAIPTILAVSEDPSIGS